MRGRNNSLVNLLLYFTTVPKCAACKARLNKSELCLCGECLEKYSEAKTRNCSVCSKALPECSCPNYYLKTHCVKGLVKLFRYNSGDSKETTRSLIYLMKYKNRQDLLDLISSDMTDSITKTLSLPSDTIVTHVPNRKSAIYSRGFDHGEILARAVAKKLDFEYVPLLKSLSKKPQKYFSIDKRYANARFELISEPNLKGKYVLIIDDVVTSGASMGNSAFLIRSLGAKNIYGAAIAIAYRDNKINNK